MQAFPTHLRRLSRSVGFTGQAWPETLAAAGSISTQSVLLLPLLGVLTLPTILSIRVVAKKLLTENDLIINCFFISTQSNGKFKR
jgi:uncharacterized membrane protein